jgi:hypothetical protein
MLLANSYAEQNGESMLRMTHSTLNSSDLTLLIPDKSVIMLVVNPSLAHQR